MNKSRFCTVIKLIINVSKKKGGLRHERGGEKIEGGGGGGWGFDFQGTMEEIKSNPETLSAKYLVVNQHGLTEKTNNYLGINALM